MCRSSCYLQPDEPRGIMTSGNSQIEEKYSRHHRTKIKKKIISTNTSRIVVTKAEEWENNEMQFKV